MENFNEINSLLNSTIEGLTVKNESNTEAVAEMLDKYGLRWNVEKEKLILPDGKDSGFYAVVRQDIRHPFATCKDGYTPFQNSELAELLLRIVDKTGYKIKGGGDFNLGAKIYLQLDTDTKIIGLGKAGATVNGYVTAINSHDGSTSLKWGNTTTNIVCMNTFNAAKKELKNSARHTISIHDKVEAAIRQINGVIEQEKSLFDQFIKLSQIPVKQEHIAQIVKGITKVDILKKDNKEDSAYALNRTKELLESIALETGRQGETLFGLLNGVTHYTSHVLPVPVRENARLESKYVGTGFSIDNLAFEQILTYMN
jgi:phage/plasmid-like protein (TIGR03299 family)